jgi:hypothetical protein
MDPFTGQRSGRYRPKVVTRAPRCIPDERFDALFAQLGSHRDRALVALWVSTGARASELLGVTGADIDPGQQLITVARKGTRVLQPLPAAPDAFVWLRLYQAQLSGLVPAGRDDPLWWTLRRPFRRLDYDAGRPGDVRPRRRRVGVELVAARSSPYRGVSDGPQCSPSTPGNATATLPSHRRRDTEPRARTSCSARMADDCQQRADDRHGGHRCRSDDERVGEATGAQLLAAFLPRPIGSSWPTTEAIRSTVVA